MIPCVFDFLGKIVIILASKSFRQMVTRVSQFVNCGKRYVRSADLDFLDKAFRYIEQIQDFAEILGIVYLPTHQSCTPSPFLSIGRFLP